MDINDKTDIVFIKNCGKALTEAQNRFQDIVAEVVESLIGKVPRFKKDSVMPYIKNIRERLENEMENGERPRFLTKDNENETLFEITTTMLSILKFLKE